MKMLVCLQCSMRAFVADEPAPSFDETREEHMVRVHPDPDATDRERALLEKAITEKVLGKAWSDGE